MSRHPLNSCSCFMLSIKCLSISLCAVHGHISVIFFVKPHTRIINPFDRRVIFIARRNFVEENQRTRLDAYYSFVMRRFSRKQWILFGMFICFVGFSLSLSLSVCLSAVSFGCHVSCRTSIAGCFSTGNLFYFLRFYYAVFCSLSVLG